MRVVLFICGCASVAQALSTTLNLRTGNDLALTPALRDYANEKVGRHIDRYDDVVQSASLILKVEHRGLHDREHQGLEAHVAEITALCSDRQVIRVSQSSEDMYASLDKLSDRLGRVLRKYKERKTSRSAVGTRQLAAQEAAAVQADDDVEDEIVDEVAETLEVAPPAAEPTSPWTLVRKKSFPMPPISVAEAILCLEYIDHDFYVFRNQETQQINVVYKRDTGGVGLIEPEE